MASRPRQAHRRRQEDSRPSRQVQDNHREVGASTSEQNDRADEGDDYPFRLLQQPGQVHRQDRGLNGGDHEDSGRHRVC